MVDKEMCVATRTDMGLVTKILQGRIQLIHKTVCQLIRYLCVIVGNFLHVQLGDRRKFKIHIIHAENECAP